jgi:hypothetical protein
MNQDESYIDLKCRIGKKRGQFWEVDCPPRKAD